MSKLRVTRNPGKDNSRLFAIAFIRYFLRGCRLELELFDGDMELAIIAQAVAISSVDALLRDPNFKTEFHALSAVVGTERQRGVNALSVAQATGLARETVRRKMLRLVELDILIKRDSGDFVVKPGVIQGPAFGRLFSDLEAETVRFVNACLDQDILVPEDD